MKVPYLHGLITFGKFNYKTAVHDRFSWSVGDKLEKKKTRGEHGNQAVISQEERGYEGAPMVLSDAGTQHHSPQHDGEVQSRHERGEYVPRYWSSAAYFLPLVFAG
jgi:hypothetical protein